MSFPLASAQLRAGVRAAASSVRLAVPLARGLSFLPSVGARDEKRVPPPALARPGRFAASVAPGTHGAARSLVSASRPPGTLPPLGKGLPRVRPPPRVPGEVSPRRGTRPFAGPCDPGRTLGFAACLVGSPRAEEPRNRGAPPQGLPSGLTLLLDSCHYLCLKVMAKLNKRKAVCSCRCTMAVLTFLIQFAEGWEN